MLTRLFGIQVHFPDKSMVWILHAGHWVVRLCWRHWSLSGSARPLRVLCASSARPCLMTMLSTMFDADESTGHVSTDCWQLSLPVTEGSYFHVHIRPALAQALLDYFDKRHVRLSCVCSWAASSRWHGSEEHRVRSEIAQNSKKSKTGTSENWRQALLGMRRVMRTRASCAT
jgi:hypothetical protein